MATDFFSVDTVVLKRLNVFFLVELERRRIWISRVTAHPNADWVTLRLPRNCGHGLCSLCSAS